MHYLHTYKLKCIESQKRDYYIYLRIHLGVYMGAFRVVYYTKSSGYGK